ncbi:IS110 family transposase [Paenibacillus sp. FSL K6-2441]|uniref:IS110 family transposase n=1 Tax=Paenibacillus sp. FSL K6-2441 TaxID=2954679 RepID=UPI0030D81214
MKLFVGIDVSSQELEACFMNADGDKLETLTVKNNLNGASHLRDQIVAAANKLAVTEIHIGLEATSVYSWHPAMYLHQDPALRERKAKVFTLNPKLISKFREAYADMDKTDRLDAWVIADRLRFGRLTTTIVMQEQYVALQRLTRMRFHLVHNLAREKQYFLQNLFYKCNAFTTEVDSSVFGHALMEMLSEKFSLDDIAEMDVADLADYLRDKGRNRFPDPERVLDGIQGAQCLLSVPGIGKVYAAGLLGELGDIERFKDQAAVAKYAGLTWRRHQSGVFEAEDTARIKSGNRFLRYYLVEAANSVRMRDEEFGEYYRKKYHEVPKNQHKRALVLTARKLVRLVDVLLRSGQLYTPRRKVNSAKD